MKSNAMGSSIKDVKKSLRNVEIIYEILGILSEHTIYFFSHAVIAEC